MCPIIILIPVAGSRLDLRFRTINFPSGPTILIVGVSLGEGGMVGRGVMDDGFDGGCFGGARVAACAASMARELSFWFLRNSIFFLLVVLLY